MLIAMQLAPVWTPYFDAFGQRIEICTTQGIKVIVFNEDGIPIEQEEDRARDHCPLCNLRTAALVPADITLISAPINYFPANAFFLTTEDVTSEYSQTPLNPRAPPFFS